jgi:hypothetical protein
LLLLFFSPMPFLKFPVSPLFPFLNAVFSPAIGLPIHRCWMNLAVVVAVLLADVIANR